MILFLLLCCNSLPPVSATLDALSAPTDLDADGVSADEDCNDVNPGASPDSPEVPYDGLDNDCNPDTPDDDLDGDGEGGATDCNDLNPSISPELPEIPYNGMDDDCDPSTLDDDLDADGAPRSADCDDGNPDLHPGSIEICGDGLDQDCDGGDLSCPVGDVPCAAFSPWDREGATWSWAGKAGEMQVNWEDRAEGRTVWNGQPAWDVQWSGKEVGPGGIPTILFSGHRYLRCEGDGLHLLAETGTWTVNDSSPSTYAQAYPDSPVIMPASLQRYAQWTGEGVMAGVPWAGFLPGPQGEAEYQVPEMQGGGWVLQARASDGLESRVQVDAQLGPVEITTGSDQFRLVGTTGL